MATSGNDGGALRQIMVVGDATNHWYHESIRGELRTPDQGVPPLNWHAARSWRRYRGIGGAELLSKFLIEEVKRNSPALGIISGRPPADDQKIVQSLAMLEEVQQKAGEKKPTVWRVRNSIGVRGPVRKTGAARAGRALQVPSLLEGSADGAWGLVIDDEGNGFRHEQRAHAELGRRLDRMQCLELVVLKLSRPFPTAADSPPYKLWAEFFHHPTIGKARRRVVVVNALDLRKQGLDISRRRSWDRSLEDVLLQVLNRTLRVSDETLLGALRKWGDVVIRFDIEGAICLSQQVDGASDERLSGHLVCLPSLIEGDFRESGIGHVFGTMAAFTAGLVRCLATSESSGGKDFALVEGMRRGLQLSGRLEHTGYIKNVVREKVDYDYKKVFAPDKNGLAFSYPFDRVPEKDTVKLAHEVAGGSKSLLRRAAAIVLRGEAARADIPRVEVGKLVTVDRHEIERLRAVDNLIRNYFASPGWTRPLSIGVFGPPGAGKSFAVKQLCEHYKKLPNVAAPVVLEANVSQWESTKGLASTLHLARDVGLKGETPFVFFDEFDAAKGADELGWLAYFLAPMQDGIFQDEQQVHQIGRAIFIFAGATSDSFQTFTSDLDPSARDEKLKKRDPNFTSPYDWAKKRKKPDFVSRLSGFLDVLGPDRHPLDRSERGHLLRRAVQLSEKLRTISPGLRRKSEGVETLEVSANVLHALLAVDKFKHGARSIEALLRMSGLGDSSNRLRLADLPSDDQLGLHVDARKFRRLLGEPTPEIDAVIAEGKRAS